MEGTRKQRSIRSIIDNGNDGDTQNDTESSFKPSTHFTAEMKLPKEGGNPMTQDNIPLFLPSASTLPELSKANVMKHSFDDIKELLFNLDIPNNLKIKLLHIYQNKYENDKRIASWLDIEDELDEGVSKNDKMISKHYVLDKAV